MSLTDEDRALIERFFTRQNSLIYGLNEDLLADLLNAAREEGRSQPPASGGEELLIARLTNERDDARSTLSAWFEVATKAEAAVTPILLDGLKSYLRTAKNGGMPSGQADMAIAVLEDYCRLHVGKDLVPVLRGIAATPSRGGGDLAREAVVFDPDAHELVQTELKSDPSDPRGGLPSRRDVALETWAAAIKCIRELGSSMSPGGLAASMERNSGSQIDLILSKLQPKGGE